ncbi:MAG: translation elongation factor Ts [Enterobacteriaceae bacterium PSpicST2]|nr:MAG: translation elongation factor Ts [Enterobacteriaceae bacterium PSpicST2]WMC18965.1 MAG: translation elongation factor Ts [Enterobacteriaceae bacterium PSpicST1]
MIKIDINLIKKLRNITGAGIIDCKNSLILSNGNIKNAIIEIRKLGMLKISKIKKKCINGIINVKKFNNYGIILEINCQTDFASKSKEFKKFTIDIINIIIKNNFKYIQNIKKINYFLKTNIINLFNKIKEYVIIKRINILKNNIIEIYNHNNYIGVLIKANFIQKKILKKIAMHIASEKPKFINIENIPYNFINDEYKIQNIIIKKTKIIKIILLGKIKKYIYNITLFNQQFIFNNLFKIKEIINKKNSLIYNFIRYELGE